MISEDKMKEFIALTKPLIQFLRDNFNPHVSAIVTVEDAEILEGIGAIRLDNDGVHFSLDER